MQGSSLWFCVVKFYPQGLMQLGFLVLVVWFWQLITSAGTFVVRDGGSRECTTFSIVAVNNGNLKFRFVSIKMFSFELSSMPTIKSTMLTHKCLLVARM